MRTLLYLLAILLVFNTCTKESPDLVFSLSGRVLDQRTQQAVPGVSVYIQRVYFPCFLCNPEIYRYASGTTDAAGHFEIEAILDKASDRNYLNLKIDKIPPEYQIGALVNGSSQLCIADHGFGEFNGYDLSSEDDNCRIELLPVTYVSIKKPSIPAEWAKDTLSLTSYNISLRWDEFDSFCSTTSDFLEFKLNDYYAWQDLTQLKNFRFGNSGRLHYQVYNNGIKSEGEVAAECPYGDTAQVELNFNH